MHRTVCSIITAALLVVLMGCGNGENKAPTPSPISVRGRLFVCPQFDEFSVPVQGDIAVMKGSSGASLRLQTGEDTYDVNMHFGTKITGANSNNRVQESGDRKPTAEELFKPVIIHSGGEYVVTGLGSTTTRYENVMHVVSGSAKTKAVPRVVKVIDASEVAFCGHLHPQPQHLKRRQPREGQ